METSATGVLNMRVARRVKRSNGSSAGVSRSPVRWTAANRFRLRTMARRSDIGPDYSPREAVEPILVKGGRIARHARLLFFVRAPRDPQWARGAPGVVFG